MSVATCMKFQGWAGCPGGNGAEPPSQSASFHSPGPHIHPLPLSLGEGPWPLRRAGSVLRALTGARLPLAVG